MSVTWTAENVTKQEQLKLIIQPTDETDFELDPKHVICKT